MVKTLLPATATRAKPSPTPLPFQTSLGPPLGHSFNNPLSGERLSRFGPRNWGQSGGATFPPPRAHETKSPRATAPGANDTTRDIEQSPRGKDVLGQAAAGRETGPHRVHGRGAPAPSQGKDSAMAGLPRSTAAEDVSLLRVAEPLLDCHQPGLA